MVKVMTTCPSSKVPTVPPIPSAVAEIAPLNEESVNVRVSVSLNLSPSAVNSGPSSSSPQSQFAP